jgi:hypothetical protein
MSKFLGINNMSKRGIYCMNFQPEKGFAKVKYPYDNKIYKIDVAKDDNFKYRFSFKNRIRIAYIDIRQKTEDVFYIHFTDSSGFIPGKMKNDYPEYDGSFRYGDYTTINDCITECREQYEQTSIDPLQNTRPKDGTNK